MVGRLQPNEDINI